MGTVPRRHRSSHQTGGRLAFVVPAEIGHAPYARPLLDYLLRNFGRVHIIAVREKLFAELSEDCWLLFAEEAGATAHGIEFTALERFSPSQHPPAAAEFIPLAELEPWAGRLRPFLIPSQARALYRESVDAETAVRLHDVATVGIGYVTGANKFFHLRPSQARELEIPSTFLVPTARNGRCLPAGDVTQDTIQEWHQEDLPNFLLRIRSTDALPSALKRYLNSPDAKLVRNAYKCRTRTPWYCVPDVHIPDAFLTYMSGRGPAFVPNFGGASCPNTIHAVRLRSPDLTQDGRISLEMLQRAWKEPMTRLSCELEGHPLGGGMLKLEPREAGRIAFCLRPRRCPAELVLIDEALTTMQQWRHVRRN